LLETLPASFISCCFLLLKVEMPAASLDLYFSDPALDGYCIGSCYPPRLTCREQIAGRGFELAWRLALAQPVQQAALSWA
jgi:hypothetical protein